MDFRRGDMPRRAAARLLAAGVLVASGGCLDYWRDHEVIQNASAVAQYLPRNRDGSLTFSAGPYRGGTAVIGTGNEAFWVQDGKGYWVNDAGRQAAPGLEQAPEPIRFNAAFISAAESGGEGT